MLWRQPGFAMPVVQRLQRLAIDIKKRLGRRAAVIPGPDQEAQVKTLTGPLRWDRHLGAEPGHAVIAAPTAPDLEVGPLPVVKIGGGSVGTVAGVELERWYVALIAINRLSYFSLQAQQLFSGL